MSTSSFHIHRWSTIKRWQQGNRYFVIQRCRRCEEWIRRTIELNPDSLNPQMSKVKFEERQKGIENGSGLQNHSSKDDIPNPEIKDVNQETGNID